ncbi:MAG: nuclease domain-containing protein [Terriglobales bacterium]
MEEPALSAPLNKFPFLYQRWANLTVVSVLLQVCAEKGYRCVSQSLVKKDSNGLFIQRVKDGEAALELSCPTSGKIVRVVPWRTDGGSEKSLNTSHEPSRALAIAVFTPEKPPVLLVFDPKYNVSAKSAEKPAAKKAKTKAAKDALAEMLSAIEPMKEEIEELLFCMDQVKTPEGREIQYAAILYPGLRKQIASDLEALPARPSDREALQKNVYDVLRRYMA